MQMDLAAERALKETEGKVNAAHAPAMAREVDLALPRPSRLLVPRQVRSPAPVVFVHGGGWVLGSPVASVGLARHIADATGRPVLSVGYRLAPEHPSPAAHEDVAAAVEAVMSGGVEGVLPEGMTLCGASAGGHLALTVVLARLHYGRPLPASLALFYPVVDPRCDSPSYRAYGDGRHGLSRDRMRDFVGAYAPDVADPLANPAIADLTGLPQLRILCGDADVLLCDSLDLHGRALDAGVASRLHVLPGRVHGFTNTWHADAEAARAIAATCAA